MSWATKFQSFIISFAALLLCGNAAAQTNTDPAVLYDSADIVATGHLQQVKESPSGPLALFAISHLVKGKIRSTHAIADMPRSSRCHALEADHEYLIYGRWVNKHLWVDPCEGTKLMSQAEADLRYLHTIDKAVSPRCTAKHIVELAKTTSVIAIAHLSDTEDSLKGTNKDRQFCGTAATSEDAYYSVSEVLKGSMQHDKIAVEHPICRDTITVDGYDPRLSPNIFSSGNELLLLLSPGSHFEDRQAPTPYDETFEAVDGDCAVILTSDPAAQEALRAIRRDQEASRQ